MDTAFSRRRKTIWVFSLLLIAGSFYFSYCAYRSRQLNAEPIAFVRHALVKSGINALDFELVKYKTVNGTYPSTQEGLPALVQKWPTSPRPSNFAYMETLPKDPWGHDFVYRFPGVKRTAGYDLFSAGPDGIPDTADDDWGVQRK